MRLIDADALLRHKRKMSGADFGGEFWDEAVLASDIKNAHTADAVPVIRCRECEYHNKPPCPMRLSFNWTEDDDFCSYGERKEGSDNEP